MSQKRYTDAQRRAFAKDWIRGLSIQEIRVKYDVGEWAIRTALRRVNPWTLRIIK